MKKSKRSEASFSLIETLIALGMMVSVVLEVSSVLGKSITLAEYGRKSSQAVWLAKAVMAKVEWGSTFYDLKELRTIDGTQKFDEVLCPPDPNFDCDYTYEISIEPWNLPIVDLLTAGPEKKDDSTISGEAAPTGDAGLQSMIAAQVKQVLGDEVLRVARAEVFWPEGAKRNSVALTFLLTNQRTVDAYIEAMNPPAATGASTPATGAGATPATGAAGVTGTPATGAGATGTGTGGTGSAVTPSTGGTPSTNAGGATAAPQPTVDSTRDGF